MELTHIDSNGNARMVDVGDKDVTERTALAEGFVLMLPETAEIIKSGKAKKGDVLSVATVAGINAAKHTWELIPMCHNIPLTCAEISYEFTDDSTLKIIARVSAFAKTGVEMEALSAVSAAALTVYDMVKAVDRGITIDGIKLLEKSGGKSGVFKRKGENE